MCYALSNFLMIDINKIKIMYNADIQHLECEKSHQNTSIMYNLRSNSDFS